MSTLRSARQNRPQLICVLGDDSGSMSGSKAEAATDGIREMIAECQGNGPPGRDKSYYHLVFIKIGSHAKVEYMGTPVRHIDPEDVEVTGAGGMTNITEALEVVYEGLVQYMEKHIKDHPQRSEHPIPLVLLYSDGYNTEGEPIPVADRIKALEIDGLPVTIACAGVFTEDSDEPDEETLKAIASAGCYLPITDVEMLSAFIAEVGSMVVSAPGDVSRRIAELKEMRMLEGG